MSMPTQTIDARQPAPAFPPTPYPGFVPLVPLAPAPVPPFGMPPAPIPPLGIAPYGMPFGAPSFGAPQFGMSFGVQPAPMAPFGAPQFGMPLGVPPAPIPPIGVQPAPIAPFGIAPFGVPPAPIPQIGAPQFGISPFWVPPAPVPPAPVPPLGIVPFGTPLGLQPGSIPGVVPPPAPVPGVVPPQLPLLHLSPTASFLVGQIALKEAASRLGDEALKGRVIASANEAIARSIEDVAGVTLHPWARAAALAWVYPTVAELALLAHRYQEGVMRHELLNVAGQLLSKGLAPVGEDPGHGNHP